MSIRLRNYRKRGVQAIEVDIRFALPGGKAFRRRLKCPFSTKGQCRQWAEDQERAFYEEQARGRQENKQGPLFGDFRDDFLRRWSKANRLKPSTRITQESIIDSHLIPAFGRKHLGEISTGDVQDLKASLEGRSPKRVANILSVLNTMLSAAVEWGELDSPSCKISFPKLSKPEVDFYELDDLNALIAAAKRLNERILCMVLLGSAAGLRRGEIVALEQDDVDFKRLIIHVRRSEWRGHLTTPKGNRARRVPILDDDLAAVLRDLRHLRSKRVLWGEQQLTEKTLFNWMCRAQRAAKLEVTGALHKLRHTFGTHMAMRGVPARTIQEWMGHADLATTQKYMHFSPSSSEQSAKEVRNWRRLGDADTKAINQ